MSTDIQVRIERSFRKIEGLEEFWTRSLPADAGDLYVTYNYDWMVLWHDHVFQTDLAKDHDLFIVVARRGGRIVGVLPLMRRTYKRRNLFPYRCLYFMGHGMTDYASAIIDHGAGEGERGRIMDAMIERLQRSKYGWDEARLHLIPCGSTELSRVRGVLESKPHACYREQSVPYLIIDTKREPWEEFIAKKGRDITGDVKRRFNKLNRAGEWSFECNPDLAPEQITGFAKEIHVQRQRDLDRESFYQKQGTLLFLEQLFGECRRRGVLDFAVLRLNGAVIAYMIGYRVGGIRYSWNVGFDPEFGDISPGKLMLYLWIKEAFENPEVTEFNFMRGDSAFKRNWTDEERPTALVQFLSPNLYSRALNGMGK